MSDRAEVEDKCVQLSVCFSSIAARMYWMMSEKTLSLHSLFFFFLFKFNFPVPYFTNCYSVTKFLLPNNWWALSPCYVLLPVESVFSYCCPFFLSRCWLLLLVWLFGLTVPYVSNLFLLRAILHLPSDSSFLQPRRCKMMSVPSLFPLLPRLNFFLLFCFSSVWPLLHSTPSPKLQSYWIASWLLPFLCQLTLFNTRCH